MTLSFKRFVPYNEEELKKGIKKTPINANWKIVSMKQHPYDDDDFTIITQHIKTKLKTPILRIENCSDKNKRHEEIGYMMVCHPGSRPNFTCVYGTYDSRYLRAFCKALRNPYFVMDIFNLKSTRPAYDYCTKKFGPIFDNLRCNEWQLNL